MRIRDARFGIVNVSVPIQQPPKDPILPEDQAKAAAAVTRGDVVSVVTSRMQEVAATATRGPVVISGCIEGLLVKAQEPWFAEALSYVIQPGRGLPFWDGKAVRRVTLEWGKLCGLAGVRIDSRGRFSPVGPDGSGGSAFNHLMVKFGFKWDDTMRQSLLDYQSDLEQAAALAEEIINNPDGGVAERARAELSAKYPCTGQELDAWIAAAQAEAEAKLAEGERQRAEEERKRQEVLLHNAEMEVYRKQALAWAREYKVWLARGPAAGGELAPALALAAAGFLVGGPVGAAAGGVVGLVAGGDKGAAPPVAPKPPSWMPFEVQAQILSEAQAVA